MAACSDITRLAPPAEAQLINYLWPLLIVLFAALLLRERLSLHHVAGVSLGLIGTIVLLGGGANLAMAPEFVPGYCAAFVAAFVWAIYSTLSRRFAAMPTDAIAGFCLATAMLATIFHVLFEETAWPGNNREWLAVAGLGVGPVGAAFYAWDVGVKHGDIRVLGATSYAAPVFSTLLLVLTGYAEPSVSLTIAAVLIAGGGLLAVKDMIVQRREPADVSAPSS